MKIEFCERSGSMYMRPENDKEEAEIYKFWVENKDWKDDFKMSIWTEQENREAGYEGEKAAVTLILSCDGID